VLDRLALSANEGAHHLAAAHAGGPTHNLEARTVLDDHITDAQLEREDELLGTAEVMSVSWARRSF